MTTEDSKTEINFGDLLIHKTHKNCIYLVVKVHSTHKDRTGCALVVFKENEFYGAQPFSPIMCNTQSTYAKDVPNPWIDLKTLPQDFDKVGNIVDSMRRANDILNQNG